MFVLNKKLSSVRLAFLSVQDLRAVLLILL